METVLGVYERFCVCSGHRVCRLIGKDSDAGRDSRQEQKGATEDEMLGWHHQLNGHEFEQTQKTVKDSKA